MLKPICKSVICHISAFLPITSTKEEQLKDLITSIQQVKDSLVNILDEYEEAGEVDKADTLTEALDALEDAYDVVNDVLLDD